MAGKRIIATVTNDLTYDRRMIRICTALQENGYEVELVGRELPDSQPFSDQPFSQKRLKCWFHKGPLFYAEYNIRLFLYLIGQKPDAICSVDLDTIMAGSLAAKGKDIPLIYDAHEYFTEVPEIQDRKWVKRIWEMIATLFIPSADLTYTVSQAIADEFGSRYRIKCEVIRNVPDRVDSSPDVPKEALALQPYLIYQGALNDGRCVGNYIRLAQKLDINLVLAGEGDLSDKLRKQAAGSDKIHFLGWVKPEELVGWTHGAKVGLNVLEHRGKSYYFSLSNKCFDYVQHGVPSISSPFPEYQNLNEKFEVMEFANAVDDEIEVALKLLLGDSSEYDKLRKNCLIAASDWCWENESRKLIVLYDELWR